jgi:recombination associated protein RdgC
MVQGVLAGDIIESVGGGLLRHAITEIDGEDVEKAIGWTSFDNPYSPDFEGSSFLVGAFLVFSLRIDRKVIPPKLIQKYYARETAKRLSATGKSFLSRNEKSDIKEQVIHALSVRIPTTPSIYDILWSYEEKSVWFFTNLKSANEELETLFSKSFNLTLIRLFPFTMADMAANLSETERDRLDRISPTRFAG